MQRKVYLVGMDGMMYPMYQKFAQEGVLPNLKCLAENGMVTEVYTSLPAYTPTNWATIMTGAHSGTHGVLRWYVDLPEPKSTEKILNSFVGNAVKAETIFEAAARAGLKSVAFHYPATSPRPTEDLYVIDGFANPAYGSTPFEVTPALVYTNTSGISRTYRIEFTPAQDWSNLPSSYLPHLEFRLPVMLKQNGEDRTFYGLIVDSTGSGYDTIIICTEKDGDTKIASSHAGSWSDWCHQSFVVLGKSREATFRFKTLELAPDGSKLSLYRSQVMMVDEFCEPKELGRELVDRFGPYQEHASPFPYMIGATDLETCLQEMEYQAQWVARAGRYMMEVKNCHLFYCQIHIYDYINHTHLSGVDPASPAYDPARAEEHWQVFRQCYIQADQMLGTILDGLDDDSCIIVVSDHAVAPDRRAINIRKFLYENGFLTVKDPSKGLDRDEAPEENIDWQKTKVFMKSGRGYDIFINAEEGSPEYLKIQHDLIRLLRTWVDEDTGCCPVAIALRKKDAPLLGFWGDQCGDVVFVNEDGYAHGYMSEWGGIKGGGCIGEPLRCGAHHGPQLPTSRTQVASNMGFLLANGPGIKKSYQRPVQELGYIHMTSVVPLICHLLEIDPPAQCQGSLPSDILEAKPSTMERRTEYPEWEPSTVPPREKGRVWVQVDMFDFVDRTSEGENPDNT